MWLWFKICTSFLYIILYFLGGKNGINNQKSIFSYIFTLEFGPFFCIHVFTVCSPWQCICCWASDRAWPEHQPARWRPVDSPACSLCLWPCWRGAAVTVGKTCTQILKLRATKGRDITFYWDLTNVVIHVSITVFKLITQCFASNSPFLSKPKGNLSVIFKNGCSDAHVLSLLSW